MFDPAAVKVAGADTERYTLYMQKYIFPRILFKQALAAKELGIDGKSIWIHRDMTWIIHAHYYLGLEEPPKFFLFHDGEQRNVSSVVNTHDQSLTPFGLDLERKKIESEKSGKQATMEEQPADLMTCHHGVKDAMKDQFYQTLDADAVLGSFQVTQTTKNAMAKIVALGLPPTSLEVMKKVVVVIALKFKGIFSQEIIKEGYEIAGYPGFDVAQALKKNSSFNKLSKEKQEKLKMMVVEEFPKEFLTPKRELYDSTILAALQRENIEVEEGGIFPLQGQEDLPIKERRAIPFADPSFRATIQKSVQEKANRAEIAKKVKAEKKEDRKRVKEDADGKNEAKKAKVAPDNVPAAVEALLPGHVPAASVEAILPGHHLPSPALQELFSSSRSHLALRSRQWTLAYGSGSAEEEED